MNNPDQHLRLLIGDFAVQLALVRAENEQLRDTVALLQAQVDAKKKRKVGGDGLNDRD